MIEQIVWLQEGFGTIDAPNVSPAEMEMLRTKDAEYGRTQGMVPASA